MRRELDTHGLGRYFIAIVPPSPVYEQAHEWKEYFRDVYHSKAALNSPPHITIHMPFEWKTRKEENLIEHLAGFLEETPPFSLLLEDFSSFPPRVIFIGVKQSANLETLYARLHTFCKSELNLFNAGYRDLPFHPHLTLAFRDLKRSWYEAAWAEFSTKRFEAEFAVNRVHLLKHDGRRWNVHHDFELGKPQR